MKKVLFCIHLFLLVSLAVDAQKKPIKLLSVTTPESVGMSTERLQRLDTMLNGWVNRGRTNGAVALLLRDGKIVYHKAFGFDDEEKKVPLRTDNIFRIASQTKAITSVAVMLLYEEGKLLLDDPVSRYIPEFAKPVVLDKFNAQDSSYTTVPAKTEITIRHLLTHTSGIGYAQIGSRESNAIYAKANLTSGIGSEPGHTLKGDIPRLAKLPLMHQPGDRWTYGLSTDVLGYLVEVVSGMNLDQFFRSKIFEPLGMKDTYFNVPAEKQNRVVSLYLEAGGKLQKAKPVVNVNGNFLIDYPKTGTTYFSGGAGLSSTALDYGIFLQMLLNGGDYNGKRILSPNSVRMMTMNQIGDVGFGVNKFGLGFGITTGKGSSILPTQEGTYEWGGAFSTLYWVDPKEKLVGILYRQLWGTTHGDAPNRFKVMVYSALND
ncbi:MAG: class A beta-lactamase-related serine hydrolase [Chitinophagaceae bacterium]|nr:MAG: class A beta-lactamase-related serine hydrolase [Chitinophagaceae bacterium]